MADSPTILSPNEFKRRYGNLTPNNPTTLTPQEFSARYGDVFRKPANGNGLTVKTGRIESVEDLAAGLNRADVVEADRHEIPPSPALARLMPQPMAEPEPETVGDPLRLGVKNMVGALGEAALMNPIAERLTPHGLGRMAAELASGVNPLQSLERDTQVAKKLSDNVKAWAEKTIPAKPPTGKYAKPPEKFLDYVDPARIYQVTAENAPLMGAFVASTLANPVAGAALMFGVEGGSAKNAMLDWEKETGQKIDPVYRESIPVIVGAVNAALERTGLNEILKVGKVAGLKGKLLQAAISTLTEGGTEGAQEITQILAESGYQGKIPANAGQRFIESLYGGLVLGLGGSGISALAGREEQKTSAAPETPMREPQAGVQPAPAPVAPQPVTTGEPVSQPAPPAPVATTVPEVEIEDQVRKTSAALKTTKAAQSKFTPKVIAAMQSPMEVDNAVMERTLELEEASLPIEGDEVIDALDKRSQELYANNKRPAAPAPVEKAPAPKDIGGGDVATTPETDAQSELRNRIAQQVFGKPFDKLPTPQKNRIIKELQSADNARLRTAIKTALKPKEDTTVSASSADAAKKPVAAEKIVSPERKPTPDRMLQIGRGMNGSVRVIFPDKAHADLYAWKGRFRRGMRYGKNAPTGLTAGVEDAGRLAKQFGVTREELLRKSDEYRKQINESVKGLEQGADYVASSVIFEKSAVATHPKSQPVATNEKPVTAQTASKKNVLQEAAKRVTQRGEATSKEYDRAINIFDSTIAKHKGKPISEQQQAVRAELESAGINSVIVDELTNPQRAARPFDDETGARRDLTSREGRIKRAVEPPEQLKSKVDAIANAGKAMTDAEASFDQAKSDIINEIESRGGEVVIDTDTGAFTIKLNVGKSKIGLADMIALGNLRQEAAKAGAYSLATVGRGFEIAATPERIAKAEPLSGTFGEKVKEFIRRNQAAKNAQKEFSAAKKTAHSDLVDFYLSERAAGREPRSLKAVAADGTQVEVLTRRQRSSAEPDTPVAGRDFAAEIAQRKAEAKKRSDAIGPRGDPFLAIRQAREAKIAKAKSEGKYFGDSITKTTEPEARYDSNIGSSDKSGLMTEQEAEQKYNMRECE